MVKILCISDTHTKHHLLNNHLPDADIIIHAGDISNRGSSMDLYDFLNWYADLPYKHKIFIAGNHDFCFEVMEDIPEEFKAFGITYLMDKMVEIEGLKIYGSPWQPEFYNWAFNLKRGDEIAQKWAMIPDDTDILITHGPPFGILDDTIQGTRVGCEDLYIRVLQIKPKLHVFGHIHFGYGMVERDGIVFVNASNLNEDYFYNNAPILVEIEK